MRFVRNINKNDYKKFYSKFIPFSFMQSYEWGQFCIKGKKQKPYYVGVVDDNNNILCASLILKTSLPFGYSYFYSPRGFLIDYNDRDLLKFFTKELSKFLKSEKAIYLKFDPEIKYQTLDNNANIIDGDNNYELHNYLKSIGYIHQGFNKLYEKNQPRYTFMLNLTDDYESKMSKSFLKNIEKSKMYDLEFVVGNENDLDEFKRIYQMTKERDNFAGYDLSYYEDFYKLFHKNNMAEIFLIKLYPNKIIDTLNKEMSDLLKQKNITKNENKLVKINKSIDKVNKDLEFFNKYKENTDGIIVSSHIMVFCNGLATALYAGSDKSFQSTFANNYMYYKKIEYAHSKGYKYLDLFGVTGDPNTTYKNLKGIYEFKKQLGGELVEFLGEYDLVSNKFMYNSLKILLPLYRKMQRIKRKIKK